MENDNLFKTPKRKDVKELFKDKGKVSGINEMVGMLHRWVTEPSLIGFDFADLRRVIRPNNRFEMIKTDLKNAHEFQDSIDSYDGALVEFDMGMNGTLGEVQKIMDSLFKKTKALIAYQVFLEKNISDENPKIKMILVWKKKDFQQ